MRWGPHDTKDGRSFYPDLLERTDFVSAHIRSVVKSIVLVGVQDIPVDVATCRAAAAGM